MKILFSLILIVVVSITLSGCATHKEFVQEQINTIKMCREAGVGVYQNGSGVYYCDTK